VCNILHVTFHRRNTLVVTSIIIMHGFTRGPARTEECHPNRRNATETRTPTDLITEHLHFSLRSSLEMSTGLEGRIAFIPFAALLG
jgi:hypothetical protein